MIFFCVHYYVYSYAYIIKIYEYLFFKYKLPFTIFFFTFSCAYRKPCQTIDIRSSFNPCATLSTSAGFTSPSAHQTLLTILRSHDVQFSLSQFYFIFQRYIDNRAQVEHPCRVSVIINFNSNEWLAREFAYVAAVPRARVTPAAE